MFPMIRLFSRPLTKLLLLSPMSANQVTAMSLLFGLVAMYLFSLGEFVSGIAGGGALVMSYILDNCDGEIARARDQTSEWGHKFDSFVDWIVNAGFFVAIGLGASAQTDENFWLYLGLAAGLGATINYFLAVRAERNKAPDHASEEQMPSDFRDKIVFIFRELFRADFCFIVLGLAVFDVLWVLLPLGAIGAQVYWLLSFAKGARRYHS